MTEQELGVLLITFLPFIKIEDNSELFEMPNYMIGTQKKTLIYQENNIWVIEAGGQIKMTLEEHLRQDGPSECLKIHDQMMKELSERKQAGKILDKH